jgi:ribonuclease HI
MDVHTDGSGSGRAGRPGGWAFVIVQDGQVLSSRQAHQAKTTSLVMELEAALAGLKEVIAHRWHERFEVHLLSDCRIALDIAQGTFMPKPMQYRVLALELRAVALQARAHMMWVKAHSGHGWNEHVDGLARNARLEGERDDLREKKGLKGPARLK